MSESRQSAVRFPLHWDLFVGANRPRKLVVEFGSGLGTLELFVPSVPFDDDQELSVQVAIVATKTVAD